MPRAKSHVLIPDCQVRPGVDTSHIAKAGKYIAKHKPDVISCIGDFWDFPSLSKYATKKQAEGQRLQDDIDAGNDAMEVLMRPIRRAMKNDPKWKPRLIYTIGNHEVRMLKIEQEHPALAEQFTFEMLNLQDWEVFPFLQPAEADGVFYCHYWQSPMSSRPIGGTGHNLLAKNSFTCVSGHQQKLDYAVKHLANGKRIHCLVMGCFYTHEESYRGPQGNHEPRAMAHLHNVKDGDFDLEVISIDRLMSMKL